MQHLEVDEEILSVRNIAVQKNQYLGLGKSIFLKYILKTVKRTITNTNTHCVTDCTNV